MKNKNTNLITDRCLGRCGDDEIARYAFCITRELYWGGSTTQTPIAAQLLFISHCTYECKHSMCMKNKNTGLITDRCLGCCGDDETRTRDLRRDRPAF